MSRTAWVIIQGAYEAAGPIAVCLTWEDAQREAQRYHEETVCVSRTVRAAMADDPPGIAMGRVTEGMGG